MLSTSSNWNWRFNRWGKGFFLVSILLLHACGGSSNSGGSGGGSNGENKQDNETDKAVIEPENTYSNFSLSDITESTESCNLQLSATSGQTLDTLTVQNIPTEFQSVGMYVEARDGSSGYLAPMTPAENGQAQMSIPIPTDFNPEGELVTLYLTNGSVYCEGMDFSIEALPQASMDHLGEIENTLRGFLEVEARRIGTTYDELLKGDEPDSAFFIPLYASIQAFEEEKNPINSEEENVTKELKEYFNRYLEKSGFIPLLKNQVAETNTWLEINEGKSNLVLENNIKESAVKNSSMSQSLNQISPRKALQQARKNNQCSSAFNSSLKIADIHELSNIMSNPTSSNFAAQLADITAKIVGTASVALPTKGNLTHVGNAVFVTQAVSNIKAALAPSKFAQLSFDVDSPIYEDRISPKFGRWSNAQVWAKNKPMNLTATVIEGSVGLAGYLPVGNYAVGATAWLFGSQLPAVYQHLGKTKEICLEIPEQQWGPFDIDDSFWFSEIKVIGSAIEKRNPSEYEAKELGAANWYMAMDSSFFGGNSIAWQETVVISEKTVSLTPGITHVQNLSDVVTLNAAINAAEPDKIHVKVPPNSTILSQTYNGNGNHTIEIQTPASETSFPVNITVESISDELPPHTFKREDSARIELDQSIKIEGAGSCIQPGANLDLTAVLSGFSNPQDITWSVTAGTIIEDIPDTTATWNVPSAPGTYTVEAKMPKTNTPQSSIVEDSVTISVSYQCVKQYLSAVVETIADGDPDCQGAAVSQEDLGYRREHKELINDGLDKLHMPDVDGLPPFYLYNSNRVGFSQTTFSGEERDSNGHCRSYSATADVQSSYNVRADGTMDFRILLNGLASCYNDDGWNCPAMKTNAGFNHYYFVPVEQQDKTAIFSFTQKHCSEYATQGLTVNVSRYRNYVGHANYVDPTDPSVSPVSNYEFTCSGLDQTFTRTINIPAAVSGSDLILIHYTYTPGLTYNIQNLMKNLEILNVKPNIGAVSYYMLQRGSVSLEVK